MEMQGNATEIDERNLLRLDALLSHGYGLSPQLVMRSKGLSIEAKALYGYLSSFAGAGDTAFPSTSRILEELDISKNRFYKIRKELVSWGFISIETTATSAGLRTVYTLPQNPIAIKTEIDEIANRRNEIKSSLVANLHNEDMVSHKGDSESERLQQSAGNEPCRQSEEFMDANTPDDYKLVAVKVGYNFALVPKIELSGIETNATETIVDISGKQYGLLAGKTFEDSQKLDAVLDMFPEYAIKDYKVPNKISVFIMPVQMYWKDDPSEIIETNFSFEDTCGLVIDDSVTFSGYTQNELVDMIGREDNGEDFVITGVGAGHYVGTCKKEPSKNKSVSEKTCNARESSGRLDADRNVDRNDIAKDKEVK